MAEEKKDAEKKAPVKKAAAPKAETAEKKAPAKKPAAKATETKAAAEKKEAAPKAAAKKPAAKAEAKPAAKAKASTSTAAAAKSDDTAAEKPAATKPAAKKAPSKDVAEARPQVLKAHHLRPAVGAKKAKTRVGRGEGSKGKTAGRGTKGTKARYQVRVGLEGGNLNSIMRAPKLRGFKNPFRVEYQVVNLEKLAELYPSGGDVTIGDLVAKGAVRKNEKVKVLGTGEISVKLNVAVDKVSSSAEQKIVAAGGSIK
ncbi:50S ribosomal protein L15 [Homoserinibacter sp. YIM 151385]|uniref:50S ribosomal protein L15 n=1 Tax=Homoserinibacter sp. YIM 151385 TaxID=2985506 RepID=UPI0022F0C555|nr:50S ribosomal protein L15 [Homoserinibacter sp. YIM 151385]WBU37695.1 50S ribosomal protein L15 [Homoserinibacter sp. YIM 151385]